jgi:C-terminal processing protease CtpA/Prc
VAIDAGLSGFAVVARRDFVLGPGQVLDLGVVPGLPLDRVPEDQRGDLGIETTEKDDRLVVEAVAAGGPAAQAGLGAGDVVVAVDGHQVSALGADVVDELLSPVHVRAGQEVRIAVLRGGKPAELVVTAAAIPPKP